MICDVSKHQGDIDWKTLAPHLDFVAIKASGLYRNGPDPYYAHNVEGAVENGVPFHVFHFVYSKNEAEARRDAKLFYDTVADMGYDPLFWVIDAESGWGIANKRAKPIAEAFEAELRRLAGKDIEVALYIAQEKYYSYALDYKHYAYIWIPGYGEKNRPPMPCDIWQYTSDGRLPGINGRVDLDMIIGDKPMSFFTGKEENKMASVYVCGASIDENGKAHGGKAGNQTGKELKKQKWYKHSKGWRVFRAKRAEVAEKIAACAEAAVANLHIGYDQYQRNTLYNEAKKYGFDVSKVTKDVECDCSALVRVCCAFAGIMGLPEGFRTPNEPKNLLATGEFVELKGSKYTDQSLYLGRGDILCTATQGHTVVVVNDGRKFEGRIEPHEYAYGERALMHGDEGADVKTMQELLLSLGYDLGKYGCDGDFGDCTELAVNAFQRDHGLAEDGCLNPTELDMLQRAADHEDETPPATKKTVRIDGGDCYIRSAPNTSGKKLGVAHKGDEFTYGGETSSGGWLLIEYKGENAWVSGKYGKLVD